jgi:hypothetical protein
MNSDVRTSDCSRLASAPVGYHRYAVGQSQSAKSRHFSLAGWIIRSFVQIITGSEAVSEWSTFCSLNSLRFLIIGVQSLIYVLLSRREDQSRCFSACAGTLTSTSEGRTSRHFVRATRRHVSESHWHCFDSNHENDRLLTSCPPRGSLRPCTGWSPQVRNGTVRASH